MDASLNECPLCKEILDIYVDQNFESYLTVGDCLECDFVGVFDVSDGEWIDSRTVSGINQFIGNVHGK